MAVASLLTLLYTATYFGYVFAAPAYLTLKSIEHPGPETVRVREWSMYWTVLAAFLCLQYFVDFALGWLPSYYTLKLAFLVSLWHPWTRLAPTIYREVLAPYLSSRQHEIDATWDDVAATANANIARDNARFEAFLQRVRSKAARIAQSRAAQRAAPAGHVAGQQGMHHGNAAGEAGGNIGEARLAPRVRQEFAQAPPMPQRPAVQVPRSPEDPATPLMSPATPTTPTGLGQHDE